MATLKNNQAKERKKRVVYWLAQIWPYFLLHIIYKEEDKGNKIKPNLGAQNVFLKHKEQNAHFSPPTLA